MSKALNNKQFKFVTTYLTNGMNGTLAYKEAYGQHLTDNVAAVNAHNLLKLPKVSEYIKAEQDKLRANADISKESLLADLQRIKNANIAGNPNASKAAIAAIELMVKMLGYNAPTESKSDITIKGEQPLFYGPTLGIDETNEPL